MSSVAEPVGTVKVAMREWERFPAADGQFLDGVSLPDDPSTRSVVKRLDASGVLRVKEMRRGITIESTSFVGRVTLGNLVVTVQPKLEPALLLRLLRYAYGLRNLELLDVTRFETAGLGLQDLLVHQLAAEARELLARGVRREYIRREERLGSPRGRVDVGRIARDGGVRAAALPCIHFSRTEDSLINQALLAGLHLGTRLATDITLRANVRRLAAQLQTDVTVIPLTGQVLRRVRRSENRLTAAYAPALRLIELLYEHEGVSLEDEETVISLHGFLFDMNRFYQALMSRFLRENLKGYTVRDEHVLRGMMQYSLSANPQNRRAPSPRPDYVIFRGTQAQAIVDAKYRDLWTTSLPREWLYQLAIYALSPQSPGTATILYPTTVAAARDARIEIRDVTLGSHHAQVILRPVNLHQLDVLLSPAGPRQQRERAALALIAP